MKNTVLNGKNISGITLGTVQLGMNYGIANENGQPDIDKSHNMLLSAIEGGITSLDTARAYGNSEDVLGSFFKKEKATDKLFINSKLVIGLPEDAKATDVEKTMYESVETSLSKLGIKKLDCLMLHRGDEMTKHGEIVPKTFERMINEGYISAAGVSVYEPYELDEMLQFDVYSMTQVPMSLFDQRLIWGGYIEKLKKQNIAVFVRSVFLQGLFFLEPDKVLDPVLKEYACPYIEKLRQLSAEVNMNVAEFAISFIRDVEGVTSLVLGADTAEQIKSNISYMNAPALSESIRKEAYETFKDINFEKIMEVLRRPKN